MEYENEQFPENQQNAVLNNSTNKNFLNTFQIESSINDINHQNLNNIDESLNQNINTNESPPSFQNQINFTPNNPYNNNINFNLNHQDFQDEQMIEESMLIPNTEQNLHNTNNFINNNLNINLNNNSYPPLEPQSSFTQKINNCENQFNGIKLTTNPSFPSNNTYSNTYNEENNSQSLSKQNVPNSPIKLQSPDSSPKKSQNLKRKSSAYLSSYQNNNDAINSSSIYACQNIDTHKKSHTNTPKNQNTNDKNVVQEFPSFSNNTDNLANFNNNYNQNQSLSPQNQQSVSNFHNYCLYNVTNSNIQQVYAIMLIQKIIPIKKTINEIEEDDINQDNESSSDIELNSIINSQIVSDILTHFLNEQKSHIINSETQDIQSMISEADEDLESEPSIKKKIKNKEDSDYLISEIQIETISCYSEIKITAIIDLSTNLAQSLIENHFMHEYALKNTQIHMHLNFFDYVHFEKQFYQQMLKTNYFKTNYIILQVIKENEKDPSIVGTARDETVHVFRVLRILDNEMFAVKKIKLAQKPNKKFMDKDPIFKQVKSMMKFNHPNIVRMVNWWLEEENQSVQNNLFNTNLHQQQQLQQEQQNITNIDPYYFLYIKMEYISYQQTVNSLLDFLFQFMQKEKIDDLQRKKIANIIFKQIVDGLEHIHQQGFFHCDIKPENILITKSLQGNLLAKITDFDDTFRFSENNVLNNTVGTYGYVKKTIGDKFEFKDDLFSLGHVLFDLLYFEDKKRLKLHQNLTKGKFPPDFETRFPTEYLLIDFLVIKNCIKSVASLKQKNQTYKSWCQECEQITLLTKF